MGGCYGNAAKPIPEQVLFLGEFDYNMFDIGSNMVMFIVPNSRPEKGLWDASSNPSTQSIMHKTAKLKSADRTMSCYMDVHIWIYAKLVRYGVNRAHIQEMGLNKFNLLMVSISSFMLIFFSACDGDNQRVTLYFHVNDNKTCEPIIAMPRQVFR